MERRAGAEATALRPTRKLVPNPNRTRSPPRRSQTHSRVCSHVSHDVYRREDWGDSLHSLGVFMPPIDFRESPFLVDFICHGRAGHIAFELENAYPGRVEPLLTGQPLPTQKTAPDGQPTASAHPARFSPDDKFSKVRRWHPASSGRPPPCCHGISRLSPTRTSFDARICDE